ncbi:sugar phosphate isomerase/epimerase family protein [Stratiformator vulcanicus]|uniref:D-tagatose 3-epimerase n=1 Tax=Stratiformator vulcanicus TaxID=2527980 RepID=A0A517R239_9PLAN|nr:sugar phosphate isomerase/epimerase family protein [Stratiformator vulcanicus]QDT37921.1 D-tagatose 3-epimerase [Stratiformator vulcanicus]
MKYGFNMLLWTSEVRPEHFELLGQLKDWGYDGVELPIFSHDEENFATVGERLIELDLGATAVSVCGPETNPIDADPKVRAAAVEYLKRTIDMCVASGATLLCGPLHSALGEFSGTGRTEDEWERAKEVLSDVGDYAAESNVTLVVEALNRFECYFLNSHADAARFCRELGHPSVKMMYDTFHANIEEKSPADAIHACSDEMAHVHISENDRSTPGHGQVRWDETFDALKESNYDGWLTIEAFGLALPELAAATRIWRRMYETEEQLAREGLAFMKANTEGE